MQTYTITGDVFAGMIKSASANLRNNVQTVNDLNVFPIPDGDTGDNMLKTVQGGINSLNGAEITVSDVANKLADGMLLSARGNSGVILSQFFEGLREGLDQKNEIDAKTMCEAFSFGVKQAYSSVSHPTEGTILTVMREATEKTSQLTADNISLEKFFDIFIDEMYISLDNTPELLPILKESGVVDSGGAGFAYLIEGMSCALKGVPITAEETQGYGEMFNPDDISLNSKSEMTFGYCTELVLQLLDKKTDVSAFNVDSMISYLESIGGDSIVAIKKDSKVKLHVHTFTPEKVLEYCHNFGEFITLKIENMSVQHNGAKVENRFVRQSPKDKERKRFGTVTVADGDGLIETFKQFGCDCVINGKQTMNPSTEDFIKAFNEINADIIFVLPNNNNILLAAKQAAALYNESQIYIVPTATIAEGYAALTVLDYSSGNPEEIVEGMQCVIDCVETGLVTYSVRDCSIHDVHIEKNDWLGISGKEILADEKTKTDAAIRLIDRMDKTDKEVIIAICGQDTTADEIKTVREYINKTYPRMELYEVDGGQDIYSFIFAIE